MLNWQLLEVVLQTPRTKKFRNQILKNNLKTSFYKTRMNTNRTLMHEKIVDSKLECRGVA
jgi:hypothetical protein